MAADRAFIIKIIESVEKHPCLWDPLLSSYGKRDKLEKAWQAIAEECANPVNVCRDKWKNVRTGFLRSLREYPENNTMTSMKRKPFYLHENMRFLLPSILRSDTSKSNNVSLSNSIVENVQSEIFKVEDSSNSELLDYEELDNFENVEVDQKPGFFSQFGPSSSNRSENSQKYVDMYEPQNKKFKMENDDENVRETKEELALMSFFKGISSDVLSLSIQNQRFFKRKLVELIDELHKQDEIMPKQQCFYYSNSSNNGS